MIAAADGNGFDGPIQSATMLGVGDEAPHFALPDQNGDRVALSDFAGWPVVVYFYPRADTPGCTAEARGFRDAWDAYRERGISVVGISDDPVHDLAAFASKHDLPFSLLSDEDGAVATAYGAYGEKSMFGRTFEGVYRTTYVVGPDGAIQAIYPDVSPEEHAEALLADLGPIEHDT